MRVLPEEGRKRGWDCSSSMRRTWWIPHSTTYEILLTKSCRSQDSQLYASALAYEYILVPQISIYTFNCHYGFNTGLLSGNLLSLLILRRHCTTTELHWLKHLGDEEYSSLVFLLYRVFFLKLMILSEYSCLPYIALFLCLLPEIKWRPKPKGIKGSILMFC